MLTPLLLAVAVCGATPQLDEHCRDGTSLLQTRGRPSQDPERLAATSLLQTRGRPSQDPERLDANEAVSRGTVAQVLGPEPSWPELLSPTMRGTSSWQELLQQKLRLVTQVGCDDPLKCNSEALTVVLVFGFLVLSICVSAFAFASIREDKEEHITPLCPQLVVQNGELKLSLNLDNPVGLVNIVDAERPKEMLCRLLMEWNASNTGRHGIAAQVRLQNPQGATLATAVARNISVSGEALALCRSGCEIFGFVEPRPDGSYRVRHRTNVHLMTLTGDFDDAVDVVSPAGPKIGGIKVLAGGHEVSIAQHVDGGLLISSYLAAFVHRRILKAIAQAPKTALPSSGGTTPRFEEAEDVKPAEQAETQCLEAVPELRDGDPFKPSQRVESQEALPEAGESL